MKPGKRIGSGCYKDVFAVKNKPGVVIAVPVGDEKFAKADIKEYQKALKLLSDAGIRTPKLYKPRLVKVAGESVWGLPMQRLKYHIWSDQKKFWRSINKKTVEDAKQIIAAFIKHRIIATDLQFMIDDKGRLYAMDPDTTYKRKVIDDEWDAYSAWCAMDQLVGIVMHWKMKNSKNKRLIKLAKTNLDGDYGQGPAPWVLLQTLVGRLAPKVQLGSWKIKLEAENGTQS